MDRVSRAVRIDYNPDVNDPNLLERDIERLSGALWSAVTTLGGDEVVARCTRLGSLAHQLREGSLAGGRRAFAEEIAAQSDDALEDTARAFALWCHLMNIAEERQRLRILHARGEHAPDGLVDAIDALIDTGATSDELRAWFEHALVMPVITAHPTEARRRSSLDHLVRLEATLGDLDAAARTRIEAALGAEVLALHGTEGSRARRPTPLDEVENALDVFRRSLLDVTPRIYRTIEDRLRARLGITWRVPAFLRWGTWVGGDRDGNPNVTASMTRGALSRQRALVIGRYLDDVAALGRSLSVSMLRARGTIDELLATLERDRERMPEVAAHARPRTIHEPWREKLWYVQARLRATLEHGDDAYVDADEYRDELAILDRSLRAAGFAAVADQDLHDAIRRVEVFGFHLASLDLRQHSGVHDVVVGELLARAGHPGYLGLDEPGRTHVLGEVLAGPIAPVRDTRGLSAEAREVLATLEVAGRARRELGPHACERYIVSFTREVSDLLEVAFLARAAGLAPGELRPVPLLEQLEDLERAGAIATAMLEQPALDTELGDELEVMLGYSDSGKQVGYISSSVALRRAQLELVEVAAQFEITLTVFHGRGGALGRGGGPASEAIRAQPVAAVRGRLRVTEQGETVTARYAQPEIAERDLELTLAAVFGAATSERQGADDVIAADIIDRAAGAARAAYLALRADEDRLARYTVAATPIEYVAHLPLGSRPASRRSGMSLDTLRAIPWVFSWTQSRHGIPGWFGVGSAIEALVAELGAVGTQALIERSRFVRALIQNCEMSLVRSDIEVAREYARLADPDAQQIFQLVADEHARTVAALHAIGRTAPLATRPYLAASVARRNPYLDILSHIQIEGIRRRRAGASEVEQLERIVFTTIGGIAAGLQTAG
ncbi:MAG: Phosphoenolpyruvate carboxylase [Deltaproteobacteria bacterium]|nr:Phosphoenolpyruvate carboxylase [Deltaproteobacteria bacterium]